MERTTFLKYIQSKNQPADPRKTSFQSISLITQDKLDKGVFQVQCSAFHTQLPAFINRKIKNLKPYTNHFKRFNIQTTKIADTPHKNNVDNKQDANNIDTQKIKAVKSNLLKELGIGRQIKPTETVVKMPQISVYQQFLQKTNTMFTSTVIETMYQNCVKRSAKLQKQTYQRSQRQYNQDIEDKPALHKQRRSMNNANKNQQQEKQIDRLHKNSKKSIKSMNQLAKPDDVFSKSDKVCIIPNTFNFQNEENFNKTDKKSIVTMKKKYSVPLKDPYKKEFSPFQENQRKRSQNYFVSKDSSELQITDKIFVSVTKKQQTIKEEGAQREIFKTIKKESKQTSMKQSPKKQQESRNAFNSNSTLNNSIKKEFSKAPILKNIKEDATINIDKSKNKSSATDIPAPSNVTAYSYIVYEPSFSQNDKIKFLQDNLRSTNKIFGNNRVLASLNCKSVVQIASLTKIMTFLLALEICQKMKIEASSQKVRIGKFQASINGTSAELQQGEMYTVEQLYYGLMLPSGNDASLALAIWGGKKLLIYQIKQKQVLKKKNTSQNLSSKPTLQGLNNDVNVKNKIVLKKKKCYERFILQMNKRARALGMTKTAYANSHGLSNNLNKSCAFDLCILCEYAMMNEKFRKVVSTVQYKCKIQYQMLAEDKHKHGRHIKMQEYENNTSEIPIDDVQHENEHSDEESTESLQEKDECMSPVFSIEKQKKYSLAPTSASSTKQGQSVKPVIIYGEREVFWQNTHKLLSKGQYIGIKTGITNTAGPCLASCIKTKENRSFIIIVLNSKKINYRFKDTETLRRWVYKRQKLQKPIESKAAQYEQNIQDSQSPDSPGSPGRSNQYTLRNDDQIDDQV